MSDPNSDDVLIKVDNASKKFCRDFKKSLWYGVKDTAADILHPSKTRSLNPPQPQDKSESSDLSGLRPSEFWANQNISFEVKRGECLGLIGHNGAGKTTLLKMLNGLMKPDTGSIIMKGRISALIALGAGFNPILTGRENVYVNGSILGLRKSAIRAKIDEIVDFAELQDAIDAPVRTYSSGMQVRLGFAVAAVLVEPDVLLLDEVLAVGDMAFTIKCLNVVRRLVERSAVVFVSHNVQFISQFCSDIMLLENGQVNIHTQNVSKGIETYLSAAKQTIQISGSGEAHSSDELLSTVAGGAAPLSGPVLPEDSLELSLTLTLASSINQAQVTLILKDNSSRPVASFTAKTESGTTLQLPSGKHRCKFAIAALGLTPGKYHFVITVNALNPERNCMRKEGVLPFVVADTGNRGHVWAPLSREATATASTI